MATRVNFRSSRALILLLMLATLVGTAGYIAQDLRETLFAGRTQQLAKTVRAAYLQVANYHQLARAGDISTDQARQAALRALANIRHSAEEYFWVTDYQGIC